MTERFSYQISEHDNLKLNYSKLFLLKSSVLLEALLHRYNRPRILEISCAEANVTFDYLTESQKKALRHEGK